MEKPKIRFKGYQEDWEQRKFGEIVEKYEDPIETPTEGYTRLGIRSHAKGTFHSYVEKGKELETAKMFRVAADKFIVNITFGWEHAVAITDENDAGKLVSHRFPQYSFNAGMNPNFFRYLILDENFKHHLELSSPGGAGRNRVLKLSDMLEYKMNFPSEAEQKKIAAYFDDLDNLITLHQRKCEETKILKKYMLQKMFPQNGHSVPEIRFSGCTEDWEQRKLIDLVDVLDGDRGKNYPTSDDFDISGHTLFLNASNVTNDGFLFQDNQFITEEKSNSMGNGKLEEDDIVVTSRGSLGHIAWYNADISSFVPYARINSGMLILRNKKEIETEYLYHFMKSSKGQSQISFISFGSAQPQLTKKGVEDLEVILPTRRDEQVQLGHYFSNLDNLITLHQQKCDELRNIKKFMLQNMFI